MDEEKNQDIQKLIKEALAEHIGTDPEEIHDEDSLVDDLHMNPAAFSDFFHSLESRGLETSKIDITDITTVGELIDKLSSEVPFS